MQHCCKSDFLGSYLAICRSDLLTKRFSQHCTGEERCEGNRRDICGESCWLWGRKPLRKWHCSKVPFGFAICWLRFVDRGSHKSVNLVSGEERWEGKLLRQKAPQAMALSWHQLRLVRWVREGGRGRGGMLVKIGWNYSQSRAIVCGVGTPWCWEVLL